MVTWRGYAHLILDTTNYVGKIHAGTNKVKVRQEMVDRVDDGEFIGAWMAHATVILLRDAFPIGSMIVEENTLC